MSNHLAECTDMKNKKYKFMSKTTGEVVTNIFKVLRTIYIDRKIYKIWNLKWSYSRKGF